MERTRTSRRIALVERPGGRALPGGPRVRRYALARIAPSPVSALGADRLERLEQVAELTPVEAARPRGADRDPAR